MKRLLAGGLLLLLVAVGILLWHQNRRSLTASQIAPADCLVYFELPNIAQTAKRWPDTALCGILSEPSVERFLKTTAFQEPGELSNRLEVFHGFAVQLAFLWNDGARWRPMDLRSPDLGG